MTEFECEIECLDEDAEIVQQCVQTAIAKHPVSQYSQYSTTRLTKKSRDVSRNMRQYEDDSDFDPHQEFLWERGLARKRTAPPAKSAKNANRPQTRAQQPPEPEQPPTELTRKQLIRIPDFEDPLCLPVRMQKRDEKELKRLQNWNNLCLERMNNDSQMLTPETGETVSSKRCVILRNVKDKRTGKLEPLVWSKTTVANAAGDRRSEVFQCVLPAYRERGELSYSVAEQLRNRTKSSGAKTARSAVLTAEEHSGRRVLVVHLPDDAVTSLYDFVDDKSDSGSDSDREKESSHSACSRWLQETVRCRMCAPCYQGCWRPTLSLPGQKTDIRCMICARTFTSIYNFLSHLRSVHRSPEVRAHARTISKLLAQMLQYHYRCRVCQRRFLSIRQLRQHVAEHQANESFVCEVGNHVVGSRRQRVT